MSELNKGCATVIAVCVISAMLISLLYAMKACVAVHEDDQPTAQRVLTPEDLGATASCVEFNGHTYILFHGSRESISVVHDPDCSCRVIEKDR